jgi:hypothetical protein
MSRKTLPAPTRWLLARGFIQGRTLDYGCGKCHDINNLFFKADGVDPYYRMVEIGTQYDTILCHFVLNVIEEEPERWSVLQTIRNLLAPTGIAYISVRNDLQKLNGCTSRGTWQGNVKVPGLLIKTTPSYRLYRLTKND